VPPPWVERRFRAYALTMGTRRDATTPPSPSTKIQPTGYHHHEVLWGQPAASAD